MATIFRSAPDAPYDVEIGGVGVLAAGGKGGIPVERAALRMPELQDEDGKPLTGRQLTTAADRFAKSRGLVTESVKEIDEQALAEEAGAFPRGLTIEQIGRAAAERDEAWHVSEETEPHSSIPDGVETEFIPTHLESEKEGR